MAPEFKWSTPEQSIMSVIVSNWVYENKNNIPKNYPNFMINNKTRDFYNYLKPSNFDYLNNVEGVDNINYNKINFILFICICILLVIINKLSIKYFIIIVMCILLYFYFLLRV